MMTEQELRALARAAQLAYDPAGVLDAPAGFERVETQMDPATGFSAAFFRNDDNDYIVAIRGTEPSSGQDLLADAGLGLPQWQNSGQDIVRQFFNERAAAGDAVEQVAFTGHSLGGALAQYAAYEFAAGQAGELGGSDVRLATFNAFGGEPGLERMLDGAPDPAVIDRIDAAHLFTEGSQQDAVARLTDGHVGGGTFKVPVDPDLSLVGIHGIDNFQDLGFPLEAAVPDYADIEGALSRAASLANFLNHDVNDAEGLLKAAGTVLLTTALASDEEIAGVLDLLGVPQTVADWPLLEPLLQPQAQLAAALSGAMLAAEGVSLNLLENAGTAGVAQIEDTFDAWQDIMEMQRRGILAIGGLGPEAFGNLRDNVARVMGEAYQRTVFEAANAVRGLVTAYQDADDFGGDAEPFYDRVLDWWGDQMAALGEIAEQSFGIPVTGIQQFVEGVGDSFDSLTDPLGLSGARDFLAERLGDLQNVADNLADLLGEAARSVGDYIRNAFDLFGSAMLTPNFSGTPLVLDLDGDGIELLALEASTVHFDLNLDGRAERTGWVGPDDGLLVLDRNGNGRIDDGRELFGDHTPLAGGGYAADGFAALAELDSDGNGRIAGADAAWEQLRVWSDRDGDGSADPGELLSLAQAGITGVDLAADPVSQILNGHRVSLLSTYETADGSERPIGDVVFTVDGLNTRAGPGASLDVNALIAPRLRGAGAVPDLQFAMSGDPVLRSMVDDLMRLDFAATSANLAPAVDAIIFQWAGSAGGDPSSRGGFIDARRLEALEAFFDTPFVNRLGDPDPELGTASQLDQAWGVLRDGLMSRLLVQGPAAAGLPGLQFDYTGDALSSGLDLDGALDSLAAGQPQERSAALSYWANMNVALQAIDFLGAPSLEARASALAATLSANGLGAFAASLDQAHLGGTAGPDTLYGSSGADLVTAGLGADFVDGGYGDDTLIGGDGDDRLIGGAYGSDILDGGAGADYLDGASGSDRLFGGPGDDTLIGGWGGDVLDGGPGADTLRADGNSTIANEMYGGQGDDRITGGLYRDRYHFDAGDGADWIDESGGAYGYVDVIEFGAGISSNDVSVARDGSDLVLDVAGSGDRLVIASWYDNDANRIEELHFANGEVWEVDELHRRGLEIVGSQGDDLIEGLDRQDDVLRGEGGADTLIGGGGADRIYGGEGDDLLRGGQFDDVLYGDAGKDTLQGGADDDVLYGGDDDDLLKGGNGANRLYGEAGDDTLTVGNWSWNNELTGGAGDDVLEGGPCADRYYFEAGHGRDLIIDGGDPTYVDHIHLGPGIGAEDVGIRREGINLVITTGPGDRIEIRDWYRNAGNRIEKLHFDDGSTWSAEVLHAAGLVVHGTEGADVLTGLEHESNEIYGEGGDDRLTGAVYADDVLEGGAGDDVLDGRGGANILRGRAGSDFLTASYYQGTGQRFMGGRGDDTILGAYAADRYYFFPGDGHDLIEDFGAAGAADRIVLKAGIAQTDVSFAHDGADLLINFTDPGDQIRVKNWYAADGYRIEQLRFQDGTLWYGDELDALGLQTEERHGTAADELMMASWGLNARLFGGSGDDALYGGARDDLLAGGAGDDLVAGGAGSDTYRFARGDGADRLVDADGEADAVQFGSGIAATDLWFWRSGEDLAVGIVGTGDRIRIDGWFGAAPQSIETFRLADGGALAETQIQQLVDAMAVFDPETQGDLAIPPAQMEAVESVIAAAWQTAA